MTENVEHDQPLEHAEGVHPLPLRIGLGGDAAIRRLAAALENVEQQRLLLRAAAESAEATQDQERWRDERHELDDLHTTRARARGRLSAAQDRARGVIDDLLRRGSPYASAAWDSALWAGDYYEPTAPPDLIAVADLQIAEPQGHATFPLLLPAMGSNVVITHEQTAAAPAHALAQSFVVRALAASPPGSLLVHPLDPAGLGQNLGLLSRLPDALTAGGMRGEPDEVEAELRRVLEHIRRLNTQELLGDDDTLIQRWRKGTARGIPCSIVLAAGLPVGLRDESLEQLAAVARAGGRCGVSLIAVVDSSRPLGYGAELEDLAAGAHQFHVTPDGCATWGSGPADVGDHLRVRCPDPPGTPQYRFLAGSLAPAQRQGANRPVRLRYFLQREQPWTTTTQRSASAVMGRRGDGSPVELELGDADGLPGHGLLVGPKGSGKTTLLHGLIHSLAYRHSPEELELHLLDMKPGVEFAKYAPRPGEPPLPQVRTVGIEADPQFALDVLHHLVRMSKQRAKLFSQVATGEDIGTLSAYRQHTGDRLHRIVLVADELQLMLRGDITEPAWQALDTLATSGPACGIHLLLATRSLGLPDAAGPRQLLSVLDWFGLRIGLRCPANELARLLGRTGTRLPPAGDRPGAGVVNAAGGAKGADVAFQAAILEPDERASLRQHLAGSGKPAAVRVSRGAGGVELSDVSHTLRRASEPTLFIGAPVGIGRSAIGVPLTPGTGRGLLLASADEQQAIATIASSLVALALQPFEQVRLAIVDLLSDELPARRPLDEVVAYLGDRLIHVGPDRVGELRDLLEPTGPPTVVAVLGLYRTGMTRTLDGHQLSAMLDWLVSTGPANGVHPMIWLDEPWRARQLGSGGGKLQLRCVGGVGLPSATAFLDRRPPFPSPGGQLWFRDLAESTSPLLLHPFARPSPGIIADEKG